MAERNLTAAAAASIKASRPLARPSPGYASISATSCYDEWLRTCPKPRAEGLASAACNGAERLVLVF